ncbi:PH domain-containing protein [Nakamurella sp. PAMC28650]|uniref:PH domain-containing protein n=1 Tax=Nakamurella sp. PAMC28650 TaxID=2762325 RepID=UPI00164D2F66|nr:PH domain-containing protein [Nakamurella sp. PAMC28650]QNK83149.1 PH domain-containing protein [Nakamurella sp. PAMC28650]
MAYPDNLLSRGEKVVLHKHPHWKVLILPAVLFVVFIGGGSALAAVLRHWQYHSIAWIVIGVIALLGLIFFTVVPLIRWRTEHFVITNFHVFFRTGILHRREHQIPLGHIQNMETSVSFWGRLLGYGSLIVESAADQPLEFENVASLPKVQSTLNQLIMDDRNRYQIGSDGLPGPGPGPGVQPARYPPAPGV